MDPAQIMAQTNQPPPKKGQVTCVIHGNQYAYNGETLEPDPRGMCGLCLQEMRSGTHAACGKHGLQPVTPQGGCPICALGGVARVEEGGSELPPGFEDVERSLSGGDVVASDRSAEGEVPRFDDLGGAGPVARAEGEAPAFPRSDADGDGARRNDTGPTAPDMAGTVGGDAAQEPISTPGPGTTEYVGRLAKRKPVK